MASSAAGRKQTNAGPDRTHPELWESIKTKWHQGSKGGEAGKWNARKAQLSVQEYKRESQRIFGDTGYKTKKTASKMKHNSLNKWTKEDWGYIDGKRGNRYLPKSVRESLTPAEKKKENAKKKGKLGTNVAYTESVRQKMKNAKIF